MEHVGTQILSSTQQMIMSHPKIRDSLPIILSMLLYHKKVPKSC